MCSTYSTKLIDGKAGGVLAVVGPKCAIRFCELVAGGACKIDTCSWGLDKNIWLEYVSLPSGQGVQTSTPRLFLQLDPTPHVVWAQEVGERTRRRGRTQESITVGMVLKDQRPEGVLSPWPLVKAICGYIVFCHVEYWGIVRMSTGMKEATSDVLCCQLWSFFLLIPRYWGLGVVVIFLVCLFLYVSPLYEMFRNTFILRDF